MISFVRVAIFESMSNAGWSEFNYLNHRSIPELPGIYCWRYRPRIEKAHVLKLKEQLEQENDLAKRSLILYESINKQLFEPFKRPEYDANLSGPLMPSYKGKVSHEVIDFSGKLEHLSDDPSHFELFIKYVNDLYDMVSAPIYIGVTEQQTLRSRIMNHVKAITRYKENGRFSDSSDEESKNLASRIVERGINPSFLWISCLPIQNSGNDCKMRLADLEFVLNRTIYPILGRN